MDVPDAPITNATTISTVRIQRRFNAADPAQARAQIARTGCRPSSTYRQLCVVRSARLYRAVPDEDRLKANLGHDDHVGELPLDETAASLAAIHGS